MKKILPVIFFLLVCVAFFQPFFLRGLLPIPSDTIVGLYHPYRDSYSKDYPNGIPFKNFLITDPVRQEYPWRFLSIALEKKGQLPLWNPYNGLGTPLLANHQSAPLYPLNVLFFLLPFPLSWSLLVFLTPFLSGIFLYLYLRVLSLSRISSFFGALVFAFCGFSIAWLEWNTVGQTLLWLPLVLLAIEKMFSRSNRRVWAIVFIFSLVASFFAGHLQTFFYVFILQLLYVLGKISQSRLRKHSSIMLMICYLLFTLLISVQLIPILQFIGLSARDVDVMSWTNPGWFFPWQHLVQFISPDFFGNPTTLNYFGVWNYAEFVGYIGIFPLLMVIVGIFVKRKVVWFFTAMAIAALLLALPTPLGVLPFVLHIPLLSTAQPTRLLSIVDFSFAILAAFGMEALMRQKIKTTLLAVGFGLILFVAVWLFILTVGMHLLTPENLVIAKRNTLIPTIFLVFSVIGMLIVLFNKIPQKAKVGIVIILLFITTLDLYRFGNKFTPFTNASYLFPQTSLLSFLQKNIGKYRIMTTDSRVLPPNFSIMYSLPSVDVYDPLYLRRYGEFIAAMERNKPNIAPPFGFNRIITPHNVSSPFINILGLKYILSLSSITTPSFKKVFTEGQTQVYENTHVLPKAFFVARAIAAGNKQDAINAIFSYKNVLDTTAIVEGFGKSALFTVGKVSVKEYSSDRISLAVSNNDKGFLVLTDSYYPTWHAFVDGKETKIYITDYLVRGIEVPSGKHTIVFADFLF